MIIVYNLDKQFKLDLDKSRANGEAIVQGNNYRFTIITERLIRLECSY